MQAQDDRDAPPPDRCHPAPSPARVTAGNGRLARLTWAQVCRAPAKPSVCPLPPPAGATQGRA